MNLPNRLYFFLIFSLLAKSMIAQNKRIDFNLVSEINDVSIGKVTDITQDRFGFMWFIDQGHKCLTRFDGYQLKTYFTDPSDSNSLKNGDIECIDADSSGNIWYTQKASIDKFDPVTNIVTHYAWPKDEDNLYGISNILVDHLGIVWVGTNDGLRSLDPKTGKFTKYRNNPNDSSSLSYDIVRAIYEDHEGTLWIGTGWPFGKAIFEEKGVKGGGLNKFNRQTGTFTRYMHDPKNPNSLINDKVRAIFEDSHGVFWVGTQGDGLHIMDRKKGTFERLTYDPAHPEKLSRPPIAKGDEWDHITFIKEDGAGAIWIGTYHQGLVRYDPITKEISHYIGEKSRPKGFSDSTSWCAYTSREGVLWVGTENETKLFYVDPLQNSFSMVDMDADVHSFYEDSAGVLWMTADGMGLLRIDPNKKDRKFFKHDPSNPFSLSDNRVTRMEPAENGMLWVGSWNGLNLFDPKTGKCTRYLYTDNLKGDWTGTAVFSLYKNKDKELYIGTSDGLYVMNLQTRSLTRYLADKINSKDFGNNNFIGIVMDKFGNLWATRFNKTGLLLLDRKTGNFKQFLDEMNIYGMTPDPDGTIWLGTSAGLYRQNESVYNFSPVGEKNSVLRTQVFGPMVWSDKENVWSITSHGVVRFNLSRNEICVYGRKFGFGNAVSEGPSVYITKEGEIFFSYGGGYFSFFPKQVINYTAPNPVLTDFKINGNSVQPGQNSPLKFSIEATNEIVLKYDQNIFSIDFAPAHFSSPENNSSYFMMQNYENEWHKAGSEKTANYVNMQPGDYIFKLKAESSYGIWGERDLKIIILPPWYRTWWAYTLYGLLFLLALWGFIRWRIRTLNKEKILLEKKVSIRTQELKEEKEIVEKTLGELKATQTQLIQQEKMASLGELTAGIAHEIQNPLNFINNFSEVNMELINELKNEKTKAPGDQNEKQEGEIISDLFSNLEKINYHGKRADVIVKGMLMHSRASTGQRQPTDINALANEYLKLSYHGLRAKDKEFNATINTDFDGTIGSVNIVAQDIGRVLLNLINNAFYSVLEKKKQQGEIYQPIISVSTKKINGKIEIHIRDNGNGVSPKIQEKIFQPFFTTKPTGQGTGLGLSISYDIIKAHGGEIHLETKEGVFAEFIVELPYITGTH
ncbi:MAG TPA: two-component regulator propeller domain-containing protein [Puia sp.]|nr:two-component regulator propeller domain-containing protein [Puia sp.]